MKKECRYDHTTIQENTFHKKQSKKKKKNIHSIPFRVQITYKKHQRISKKERRGRSKE
jgi:hypothetical protein